MHCDVIKLISGEGHVVTQVYRVAYPWMRSKEKTGNRAWPQIAFCLATDENVCLDHHQWSEMTRWHYLDWIALNERFSFWIGRVSIPILKLAYNGEVTSFTWPEVTDVKIRKRPVVGGWEWRHQVLKGWKDPVHNGGCGTSSNIFGSLVTRLDMVTWPDMAKTKKEKNRMKNWYEKPFLINFNFIFLI